MKLQQPSVKLFAQVSQSDNFVLSSSSLSSVFVSSLLSFLTRVVSFAAGFCFLFSAAALPLCSKRSDRVLVNE